MDPRLELALTLLRKGRDDLVMARRLAGDLESPDWGVGFHVQQAIEKAIKSVLCVRGIEYPRTHSISALLDLLGEDLTELPVASESLKVLTPYGVLFRYDEVGPSDAELAALPNRELLVALATKMVDWAQSVVTR